MIYQKLKQSIEALKEYKLENQRGKHLEYGTSYLRICLMISDRLDQKSPVGFLSLFSFLCVFIFVCCLCSIQELIFAAVSCFQVPLEAAQTLWT